MKTLPSSPFLLHSFHSPLSISSLSPYNSPCNVFFFSPSQKFEGDGRWVTLKMKEDWNALEMEDVETKNEELMLRIKEVEVKNEELRLKIEDIEGKNVIFRVGIGIVYFGGRGWLKKKMLALP
ncbi:hypothetical protein RHSIM_Rhsim10G0103400 [Rhododendron simsii]|uniref:Uncharacterized protein n=1 Tax=Rhododendron simsii TaxID=118357 RepID=A0A834G9L7_RHOSS|nr:hypothetical protein RHSIM_Rhsim10G0103400 [Rhododendron simsii]